MDEPEGTHRTRSRAAPNWTVQETLILVNEIHSVESEWGPNLPSFQKWQQIVENCNALEVNRNLNQCKRKWDALLSDYKRIKNGGEIEERAFPVELVNAVHRCVSGEAKEDEDEEEVPEVAVMDTDPESDPEAQGRAAEFVAERGSKKRGRRMKRQKHRVARLNPWGYFTSGAVQHEEPSQAVKHEESGPSNEIPGNSDTVKSISEKLTVEQEQVMAAILQQNALQINAVLEGDVADDVDYKLADLKDPEAVQTDLVRRQGDMLIDYLGKISATLNQVCELVQQCK